MFDFNGTLFWDTAYHSKAFDLFVERYIDGKNGYQSRRLSPDDKRDRIMGQPNDLSIPFIFGKELSKEEIMLFGEEKEQIYRDLCRGKVELASGCRTLFQRLMDVGIPFTIASSADRGNIDFYYQETDLERWIPKKNIVYNDGSILHGKPAPDIFLKAAQTLGCSPSDCVIFEDSTSGIRAAEAAGASMIIVVTPNLESGNSKYPQIDDFRKAIQLLGL